MFFVITIITARQSFAPEPSPKFRLARSMRAITRAAPKSLTIRRLPNWNTRWLLSLLRTSIGVQGWAWIGTVTASVARLWAASRNSFENGLTFRERLSYSPSTLMQAIRFTDFFSYRYWYFASSDNGSACMATNLII